MSNLVDEFKRIISKWKVEDIERFANIFNIDITTMPNKKMDIITYLIEKHWDRIEELANEIVAINKEKLRINEAKKILIREYSNKIDSYEIEKIVNKFQLVMYIYKIWGQDYREILNEIKFRTQIEKNRSKWWYSIKKNGGRDINEILLKSKEIEKSVRDSWNTKYHDKILVRIKKVSDTSMHITVFSEYGRRFYRQFKFRSYDDSEIKYDTLSDDDFQLQNFNYYPLKIYNLFLEFEDDKYLITLDFDPHKDEELVNHILTEICGQSVELKNMERIKPENINNVENKIEKTMEDKNLPDLLTDNNKLKKRKENALKKVDELQIPDDKKEKIKDYIKSFEWKGILAKNLLELGISKLDQIIKPEDFFRNLVTNKDSIKELIEKIREIGKEDVVKIKFKMKNKNVIITLSGKIEESSLNEEELKAVELILGEKSE